MPHARFNLHIPLQSFNPRPLFLARTGSSCDEIRDDIAATFGYDLERTVDSIRPEYRFDVACQGTVPEAVISFLDSTSWEDAVRNAVSLGGDSDTLAAIAWGIAEAFYGGVPVAVRENVLILLPPEMRRVAEEFRLSTSRGRVVCQLHPCGGSARPGSARVSRPHMSFRVLTTESIPAFS